MSCLPLDDSSEVVKKQRTHYEESLRESMAGKARVEKFFDETKERNSKGYSTMERTPWVRAKSVAESWNQKGGAKLNSSVSSLSNLVVLFSHFVLPVFF